VGGRPNQTHPPGAARHRPGGFEPGPGMLGLPIPPPTSSPLHVRRSELLVVHLALVHLVNELTHLNGMPFAKVVSQPVIQRIAESSCVSPWTPVVDIKPPVIWTLNLEQTATLLSSP
jgi:hypothetical protein